MQNMKLKELFETISPVFIDAKSLSITVGLSRRFFLFTFTKNLISSLEEDPYLNFISLLKSYKILGKFLYGTISEFYRDRNKIYFKKFFADEQLYELIRNDIEWLAASYGHIKVTISKNGLIVYDNYQKNKFNVLLFTIHSGNWVPGLIREKMHVSKEQRHLQEDTYSNRLYCNLVLKKNGIWIDNKQSRFACDFNRPQHLSVYKDKQEPWVDKVWKEPLTEPEIKELQKSHVTFYLTLRQIIDSYRFNIIFDGHTMTDAKDRSEISFGTEFIPNFYMPVVLSMREKLKKLGYTSVSFNSPYYGGNILRWLKKSAPDLFICSMEINKKLYMNEAHNNILKAKLQKITDDLENIFNMEIKQINKLHKNGR